MEKLNQLTKEQEAKMIEVKNFWLDYIFSCKHSIDKKQAKIGIDFIYNLAKLQQPQIIYVDSPMGCQIATMYLKEYVARFPEILKSNSVSNSVRNSVWNSVSNSVNNSVSNSVNNSVWNSVSNSVWNSVNNSVCNSVSNSVRNSVRNSVWNSVNNSVSNSVSNSVRNSVRNSVSNSVWNSVSNSVSNSVNNSVRGSVRDYEAFASYGNISDYGWVSFYDFFTEIGIINHDGFNSFKKLLLSGVYDCIQLEGICIVSNMPDRIERDERGRLHCETDSAIHFRDGYEIFYWHGIEVPRSWILEKSSITKEMFISEKNAEKRRCLKEIIGNNQLITLLDVTPIDEDVDAFNHPIILFRTKEKDELLNDFVYFLKVVDPSTLREYYLCVPECKNVWDAKSWTFQNKKIEIRHGDVGLLNLQKTFNTPIFES